MVPTAVVVRDLPRQPGHQQAGHGLEGQTRFVLRKALAKNLPIIVVVNKVDRPDARITDRVTLDETRKRRATGLEAPRHRPDRHGNLRPCLHQPGRRRNRLGCRCPRRRCHPRPGHRTSRHPGRGNRRGGPASRSRINARGGQVVRPSRHDR
nr:GTP-binding protein [Microlunatus antarcticus]